MKKIKRLSNTKKRISYVMKFNDYLNEIARVYYIIKKKKQNKYIIKKKLVKLYNTTTILNEEKFDVSFNKLKDAVEFIENLEQLEDNNYNIY